jgi:hypothetical protein
MSTGRNFEHTATRIEAPFGKISAANGSFATDNIIFHSESYAGDHEMFHNIGRDLLFRLGVVRLPRPFSSGDEAIAQTIQSIFKFSEVVNLNGSTFLKLRKNPESFRGTMVGFFADQTDGFYNVVSKEYTSFAIKKLFPDDKNEEYHENDNFTNTEQAIKEFLQSGVTNSVIDRLNTLSLGQDNYPSDFKRTCDLILEKIPSWIKDKQHTNEDDYLLFEIGVDGKNDDLYNYYKEAEFYLSSMRGASSLRINDDLSEPDRIQTKEKIQKLIRLEKALKAIKRVRADSGELKDQIHLILSEIEPDVYYYYGLSRL